MQNTGSKPGNKNWALIKLEGKKKQETTNSNKQNEIPGKHKQDEGKHERTLNTELKLIKHRWHNDQSTNEAKPETHKESDRQSKTGSENQSRLPMVGGPIHVQVSLSLRYPPCMWMSVWNRLWVVDYTL